MYPFRKFDLSSSNGLKIQKNFDTPKILSSFIFSSYLPVPENFMCLACLVEKFEFCWSRLRGAPHFDTSKLCEILAFFYSHLPQKFYVNISSL